MSAVLTPVGVREAKNRFSSLAAEVNASGCSLTVMKNNAPWVTIVPADPESIERHRRLDKFRALTASIESGSASEPMWGASLSDREILNEERVRRFG